MSRNLASEIASALEWSRNANSNWKDQAREKLKRLCAYLPHGSGIDSTHPEEFTGLDLDDSTPNKLVINVEFHHMNDWGFYDGWSSHRIIVTPEFSGVNLRITGRDRNEVKDYLYQTYEYCLTTPFDMNGKPIPGNH